MWTTLFAFVGAASGLIALIAHFVELPKARRQRLLDEKARLLDEVTDFANTMQALSVDYFFTKGDPVRDAQIEQQILFHFHAIIERRRNFLPAFGNTLYSDRFEPLLRSAHKTITGGVFQAKTKAEPDQGQQATTALKKLLSAALERKADLNC